MGFVNGVHAVICADEVESGTCASYRVRTGYKDAGQDKREPS